MFKRIAALALTLLLIGSLSSCIFDPPPAKQKKEVPVEYKDLTEKWHVLFNLEQSYNQRDAFNYIQILDENDFVFFLSPGDVGGVDNNPASWDYQKETEIANTMFNKGGGKRNNPILSISLDLLDLEQAPWIEFNNVDYPGWYEATVSYSFTIDTEDETVYIVAGTPRAQFRVRQDAGGKWRLVQWNDLAEP